MELNRAKLITEIREVVARYRIEDFEVSTGMDSLKQGIRTRLAMSFREHAPKEVFLTDWVLN